MEAKFIQQLMATSYERLGEFPGRDAAGVFVDRLFHFLFMNTAKDAQAIEEECYELKEALARLMTETEYRDQHVAAFFDALPKLYTALMNDASAILAADPAARDITEVVITYPGFYATVIYRLSHQLWQQHLRLLPRIFTEYAHSKTGIDIHPAARIGERFAIDHGTGVVIGETAVVGNDVKLYQGVTLGALSVDKALAQTKRHPTIEDEVVIYSNATILGGNTVVGMGTVIGGNVWLTQSVPSNSVVYHNSEIRIRDKVPFSEPLNFII